MKKGSLIFFFELVSFWRGSAIFGVMSCKVGKQKLGIFHCFGKNSNLIQRRSHCHHSITRNRSIARLKAYNSTKGGWLSYASSGIGSERSNRHISCYRYCRTAATSTRNTVFTMRIESFSITRSFRRASHSKFIHIGLSDHQGPSLF